MLDDWLANDKETLLMLRALGGFGKSALAWTWFNRVDRAAMADGGLVVVL